MHYISKPTWRRIQARLCLFTLLFAGIFMLASQKSYAQSCWLEVNGKQIVRASNGQPIILRAVGLGNWALQEGYMLNPQGCTGCPGTQWEMKKRYYDMGQSAAQVEAFYQSWRDNFITKADIDYIASLGFNSVRLPMHYELFLTAAQRAVRNNVINDINYGHDTYKNSLQSWYNNNQLFNDANLEGFQIIDKLISWCAANDMYIILDLHAAPGGQGSDRNIADIFHANNLWQFPVFQDVTNRLWQRISQRYINEPRIAFYDLINEPNNVPGGGQAIHSLLQRLITTIRNNGDNHMIMVEGNGWGNNYDYLEPFTFSPNWGLVYNAHRYWIPEGDDWVPDSNPNQINRMANLVAFRDTHNVPVWIGETGENTPEWLRQNIVKLEQQGIGWCHWTYKRHDVGENAALRRITGPYPTDGPSAMAQVLENIKFQNNVPNTNTIAAVTQDLPDPWTTGCSGGSSPACSGNYQSISANIQAESFCTMQGVQTESTTDAGGGQNVGYIDAGDWMAYRVSIPTAGLYTVQYRVASQSGGGSIRLEPFGGGTAFGTVGVPATGGWQSWTTISHTVTLGAGNQDIAIAVAAGGFNINWFKITATGGAPIGQTIWLRGSNNQYVSSENGTQAMRCNRASAGGWEQFTVVDGGGGKIALRGTNNQYVSSENGTQGMRCNRATIGGWEVFDWVPQSDGTIALRGNDGQYVSSENGVSAMMCNRASVGGWEKFTWGAASGARMMDEQQSAAVPETESEPLEPGMLVYPNPVTGRNLSIDFMNREGINASAVLTSLDGRKVVQTELTAQTNQLKLPPSIAKGLYILTVSYEGEKVTRKLLVE